MEKSVFDITLKMQSHKTVITTTKVNNFVGMFVVKLHGVKTENHSFKQLPLNKNDIFFNENLNDIH